MKRISLVGPKSCGDWIGYDRPVQFLDHLTVIKTAVLVLPLVTILTNIELPSQIVITIKGPKVY